MAIKNKAKKMPLSTLDKTLYGIAMSLVIAFSIGALICLGFVFPRLIALRDPEVMASYQIADIFTSLPMIIFLGLTPMLLIAFAIDSKLPLFGNKSYKPKWSETVLRTTPLFSKQFIEQLTEQKKMKILKVSVVLIILFVICLSLMLLGWNCRVVLRGNGEIKQYNVFDQETSQRHLDDADSITIRIVERWRRTKYVWHIELEVKYQDAVYVFSQGEFLPVRNSTQLLQNLMQIKDIAKDKLTLDDGGYMDELIDLQDYTEREKQLLYELFEKTP